MAAAGSQSDHDVEGSACRSILCGADGYAESTAQTSVFAVFAQNSLSIILGVAEDLENRRELIGCL
jgi:hypothetical protein